MRKTPGVPIERETPVVGITRKLLEVARTCKSPVVLEGWILPFWIAPKCKTPRIRSSSSSGINGTSSFLQGLHSSLIIIFNWKVLVFNLEINHLILYINWANLGLQRGFFGTASRLVSLILQLGKENWPWKKFFPRCMVGIPLGSKKSNVRCRLSSCFPIWNRVMRHILKWVVFIIGDQSNLALLNYWLVVSMALLFRPSTTEFVNGKKVHTSQRGLLEECPKTLRKDYFRDDVKRGTEFSWLVYALRMGLDFSTRYFFTQNNAEQKAKGRGSIT